MYNRLCARINKLTESRNKIHEELTQVKQILRVPYLAAKYSQSMYDELAQCKISANKKNMSLDFSRDNGVPKEFLDKQVQTERTKCRRLPKTPTGCDINFSHKLIPQTDFNSSPKRVLEVNDFKVPIGSQRRDDKVS